MSSEPTRFPVRVANIRSWRSRWMRPRPGCARSSDRPDAIIVIDERTHRVLQHDGERLFGYAPDEVRSAGTSDAHAVALSRTARFLSRRYLARESAGSSASAASSSASARTARPSPWSLRSARSLRDALFTGFIRDLTERQQTERRLQELQSELAHISRLTAMGEMASTLAHEINQPLTAITNYLQGCSRLLETVDTRPRRARVTLGKAAEQALRAGNIIRRLREFVTRGESERRAESLRQAGRGSQRARSGGRQGERHNLSSGSIPPPTWCWSTQCRSSRSCSISCATPSRP